MIFMIDYVISFLGCLCVAHGALPKQCSGSTYTTCYPIIPTMPQISGCHMTTTETLTLRNYTGTLPRPWTLPTLPIDLFEESSVLKRLVLDYVGIQYLYSEIFQPIRDTLQIVSMDGNLLEHFPSSAFRGLKKLMEIKMRFQYIKSFIIETNIEWEALTNLDLSGNELETFDVQDLQNVGNVSIILDFNKLFSLNTSEIHHMYFLSARANSLEEIYEKSFQYSLASLKHLNLSENALDDKIWKSLQGLNLESLVLSGNNIAVIRSSVLYSMKLLKYLDLSNNRITSLGNLQLRSRKLTYLFLSANDLEEFPSSVISKTETFENPWSGIMDLSLNKMQKISLNVPKCDGDCKILLGGNRIMNVSFDLTQSSTLGVLNLSTNSLRTLPYSLPKANHYVISNNPLNTRGTLESFLTTMKQAVRIEAVNTSLYCDSYFNSTLLLPFDNLEELTLNNNCIPLDFFCALNAINKPEYPAIYMDNITGEESTRICKIETKTVKVLSIEGSGLNDSIFKTLFANQSENVFSNIQILILRRNQLERLSVTTYATYLYLYRSLFLVDFSENLLPEIGNFSIQCYRGLRRSTFIFNLAKNNITQAGTVQLLLNYRVYLSNLYINFSKNGLHTIDKQPIIYYINLDHYSINFQNRIVIDISYNKLKNVKESMIFKMGGYFDYNGYDNLKIYINISYNSFETYMDCNEKEDLKIYYLDISFNNLSDIPNMPCQMAVEMRLNNNNITEISTHFPYYETKILYLDGNSIDNIAETAFTKLTMLEKLSLKRNALTIFPLALEHLRGLKYLDISFNGISHITEFDITGKFPRLETLILSENSLEDLPANSPMIHCDCSMLFLRNWTLQVTGRCTSPAEIEGFHVSCFPTDGCVSSEPLYITKKTTDTCRSDVYSDMKLFFSNINRVDYRIVGALTPTSLRLEAYNGNIGISVENFNRTGRYHTFIVDNIENVNMICVTAYFTARASIKRCIAVDMSQNSPTRSSNKEMVSAMGSLFGISVLINICTILFIFISRRRRTERNEGVKNRTQKKTQVEQHTYEASMRGEIIEEYDELTTRSIPQKTKEPAVIYEPTSASTNIQPQQCYENLCMT